ncbi:MAG: prohibitin family protein [Steroidobacteraceae bacterium]
MTVFEAKPVGGAQLGRLMRYVSMGVIAVIALVIVSCSASTVQTGHRGIKVRFGQVVGEGLPEGLYFVNPFTTHIAQMDVRVLKWEGTTQAYTKDVQQAAVHFTLNYRLDPAKAHTVYREVGEDWSAKLVGQVVTEQIKRVFGQFEAVKLIEARNEAARTIETDIGDTLAQRSILVTGFQLTNIDYTDEFERAVEAKVVAVQNAIAEQNRTVQIEQQAKQKVISAEAEATSMKIRANALEANPKLVEWEAVQKWNGQLPQYMLSGNGTPFIQVPNGR